MMNLATQLMTVPDNSANVSTIIGLASTGQIFIVLVARNIFLILKQNIKIKQLATAKLDFNLNKYQKIAIYTNVSALVLKSMEKNHITMI